MHDPVLTVSVFKKILGESLEDFENKFEEKFDKKLEAKFTEKLAPIEARLDKIETKLETTLDPLVAKVEQMSNKIEVIGTQLDQLYGITLDLVDVVTKQKRNPWFLGHL